MIVRRPTVGLHTTMSYIGIFGPSTVSKAELQDNACQCAAAGTPERTRRR